MSSYRENYKGSSDEVRATYPPEAQRPRIVDARFNAIADKARNVTSQFGEDGLVEAIFEIIGVKYKRCFEVGASDGEFFSNTKALRDAGWEAILMEANREDAERLAKYRTEKVKTIHAPLTTMHGVDFFFGSATEKNPLYDLGVIDTDAGDYDFWAAMKEVRPRVVCIECADDWGLREGSQARRETLLQLGKEKGYTLVALTWCNALFVVNEEIPIPSASDKPVKLFACMSCPRFGPLDSILAIHNVLRDIPIAPYGGAWWEKGLQHLLLEGVKGEADFAICFDFDGLFTQNDFDWLLNTIITHPEIDAIAPLQPRRGHGTAMLSMPNAEGTSGRIHADDASVPIKVRTAHFGLTIIRMSALRKMPLPWFKNVPGEGGSWVQDSPGQIDADIYFWFEWEKAGNSLYILPAVQIGHIETLVAIPNPKGGSEHFYIQDWRRKNKVAVSVHKEPLEVKEK